MKCAFADCCDTDVAPLLWRGVPIADVCETHGILIGTIEQTVDRSLIGYTLLPARCAGLTLTMNLARPGAKIDSIRWRDVIVHTFTYRMAAEKPRSVDARDVGLRALLMQCAAMGRIVRNAEALRPRVHTGNDGGTWVTIEGVETEPDPAFDEPCEFCERFEP